MYRQTCFLQLESQSTTMVRVQSAHEHLSLESLQRKHQSLKACSTRMFTLGWKGQIRASSMIWIFPGTGGFRWPGPCSDLACDISKPPPVEPQPITGGAAGGSGQTWPGPSLMCQLPCASPARSKQKLITPATSVPPAPSTLVVPTLALQHLHACCCLSFQCCNVSFLLRTVLLNTLGASQHHSSRKRPSG